MYLNAPVYPFAPLQPTPAYTHPVDCWTRLDRFLILGTEGGSYYANQEDLTLLNVSAVAECLEADPLRAVQRIVDISYAGRAPKNEPALYALAIAASHGTLAVRQEALSHLSQVARTGTHLLHFVNYVQGMRGWGRSLKRAVGQWFLHEEPEALVYQMMKYRSRDKWSMRDLLRLSHPNPTLRPNAKTYNLVLEWVTQGWHDATPVPATAHKAVQRIGAFEELKRTDNPFVAAGLINKWSLPREAVPTHLLDTPAVWEALLPTMGITALIRNLPTMTSKQVLANPDTLQAVVARLQDPKQLSRGRVHPIQVLTAALTYGSGKSIRGTSTWKPIPAIVEALNNAFYLAFKAAEPTEKNIMIALDVSGSMTMGNINGVPGLTPRLAAAAMALATVNIEPHHQVVAFSDGSCPSVYTSAHYLFNHARSTVCPFPISSSDRLDQVAQKMGTLSFGYTNCALPVLHALKNKTGTEVFIIYTDSEHNVGPITVNEALVDYRRKTGIPAKLIVQAFVANDISVADPADPLQMDINGLDSATPALIEEFIHGSLDWRQNP